MKAALWHGPITPSSDGSIFANDPEMRTVYPVTVEMERRAKVVEEHPFQKSGYVVMEDEVTRVRWVK